MRVTTGRLVAGAVAVARANSSATVSITFTRGGAQRSVQVPVTVL